MLNHSVEVFKEITDYLTWQHIPYRAYNPGGIVTFSASTTDSENLYDYRVNISKNDFWVEVTTPIKVPQAEKISDASAREPLPETGLKRGCVQLLKIEKCGDKYYFDFSLLDRWISKVTIHQNNL